MAYRGLELQWGHGDEAVEERMERERLCHRRNVRFNGATAMKPWKSNVGHKESPL